MADDSIGEDLLLRYDEPGGDRALVLDDDGKWQFAHKNGVPY